MESLWKCHWARHFIRCLVLKNCWLGCKESEQTNRHKAKKNRCVYYLMKISNRVGRSIFFLIFLYFFYYFFYIFFYLIWNRSGRFFFSLDFFFTPFFSTIYVPSDNANYLVWIVLYDPSLDQRIFRKEENIFKLKTKLICWFILWQNPKAKHRFPLHHLRHWTKGTYLAFL